MTGHLYGVMYNNTLTVLTFSVNLGNDEEASINHTTLQLHMPAEIYLCGILHVGECEEKLPDTFQVRLRAFMSGGMRGRLSCFDTCI